MMPAPVQGYPPNIKTPPSSHSPTVGFYGEAFCYERGTPAKHAIAVSSHICTTNGPRWPFGVLCKVTPVILHGVLSPEVSAGATGTHGVHIRATNRPFVGNNHWLLGRID